MGVRFSDIEGVLPAEIKDGELIVSEAVGGLTKYSISAKEDFYKSDEEPPRDTWGVFTGKDGRRLYLTEYGTFTVVDKDNIVQYVGSAQIDRRYYYDDIGVLKQMDGSLDTLCYDRARGVITSFNPLLRTVHKRFKVIGQVPRFVDFKAALAEAKVNKPGEPIVMVGFKRADTKAFMREVTTWD